MTEKKLPKCQAVAQFQNSSPCEGPLTYHEQIWGCQKHLRLLGFEEIEFPEPEPKPPIPDK